MTMDAAHCPARPGPGHRRRRRGHGGPELQPHRHRAPPPAGGVGRPTPDERPCRPRHRGHLGHRPGHCHRTGRPRCRCAPGGPRPRDGAPPRSKRWRRPARAGPTSTWSTSRIPPRWPHSGERLGDSTARLDALVHNAGALTRTYQTTADGVERTLATHVLGPYLLTAALAPLLFSSAPDPDDATGAPATIVTVSSGGMYSQRFDLGALEAGPDGYDGVVAYARAKRAQLVLAARLGRPLRPGRGGQLRHAPGLGGHARPGRGPAQVPHPRASPPAHARRRGRYRGVAGRRRPHGGGAGGRDHAGHLGLLPRSASPVRSPLPGHPPERTR